MMNKPAKLLAYSAALLACVGVFMIYIQPEFMVMLAGQLWACF
jgi:hypothetical protein